MSFSWENNINFSEISGWFDHTWLSGRIRNYKKKCIVSCGLFSTCWIIKCCSRVVRLTRCCFSLDIVFLRMRSWCSWKRISFGKPGTKNPEGEDEKSWVRSLSLDSPQLEVRKWGICWTLNNRQTFFSSLPIKVSLDVLPCMECFCPDSSLTRAQKASSSFM